MLSVAEIEKLSTGANVGDKNFVNETPIILSGVECGRIP